MTSSGQAQAYPVWSGEGARLEQRAGGRWAVRTLCAAVAADQVDGVEVHAKAHAVLEAAENYLAAALAELASELNRLPGGNVAGMSGWADGEVPPREGLPMLWSAVQEATAAARPDYLRDPAVLAAHAAIETLLGLREKSSWDVQDAGALLEQAADYLEGAADGAYEDANTLAEMNAEMRSDGTGYY